MRAWFITTMVSASRIGESRWAMTKLARYEQDHQERYPPTVRTPRVTQETEQDPISTSSQSRLGCREHA